MDILEKVIDIKESEGTSDTPIWEWLRRLIKTLGEEGTSSDESEVDEQTGQTIYRVHKMPWRRNVEIEIMQHQHQSQQLLLVAREESKQWRNELNTHVQSMEEVTKR